MIAETIQQKWKPRKRSREQTGKTGLRLRQIEAFSSLCVNQWPEHLQDPGRRPGVQSRVRACGDTPASESIESVVSESTSISTNQYVVSVHSMYATVCTICANDWKPGIPPPARPGAALAAGRPARCRRRARPPARAVQFEFKSSSHRRFRGPGRGKRKSNLAP
jgi:hypothetical protein